MICPGCGGIIGRDCFHPQDCQSITQQKAQAFDAIPCDVNELLANCVTLGQLRSLVCDGRFRSITIQRWETLPFAFEATAHYAEGSSFSTASMTFDGAIESLFRATVQQGVPHASEDR